MSHQTGITASEELTAFFASCKDGSIRMVKVSIKDEQLVLAHKEEPVNTWEDDYDQMVLPNLEEKQPCYIFFRTDDLGSTGGSHQWIFISWSPDFSPVRQKMLYAGTRSTIRKEFGGNYIINEIFGTVLEDVNLSGYNKHKQSQEAPAPLTYAEEELDMIKKNEGEDKPRCVGCDENLMVLLDCVDFSTQRARFYSSPDLKHLFTQTHAEIGIDTKHQTVQGISFPLTQNAMDKLEGYREGAFTYIQMSLDVKKEIIDVEEVERELNLGSLVRKVPTDHARYHLLNFKHTHEGDYLETTVFIYSMPGYKCSIKERMLYSSCKSPLIDTLERSFGIEIVKKIEIDDPKELTEDFLQEEVHPKKSAVRQAFSKPKGPGGRGPRRMTKPADGES